jgi:hypothetical protein
MDSSNDQEFIDALAFYLVANHGYRLSLSILDKITATCAATKHAECRRMGAFWSRVCDAIRQAGRAEPISVSEGSLHRPANGTAIPYGALLEPAASSRIDRHVGQRLRARRIEIGYPVEVLARSLDLSMDELKRIEAGRMRLAATKLITALQLLRIDASYVFQGYPSVCDERAVRDDDPTCH